MIDLNLKLCDYFFLNIQKNYYNKQDVWKVIGSYSDKIIDIVCWTKTNPMPANGNNITNAWEYILIMSDKHRSIKSNHTYTKNHIETNVYSDNPYKKIHRAVMNPKVVEWFINTFTKPNDKIFDCFMGVGTTGYVASNMNRNFEGIEISDKYFDVARKRLETRLENEEGCLW